MGNSLPVILLFFVYFHSIEGLYENTYRNQKAVNHSILTKYSDNHFIPANDFIAIHAVQSPEKDDSPDETLSPLTRLDRRPRDLSEAFGRRRKRRFVSSSSVSEPRVKSSRQWYEAPRVQYQDFPTESVSYTNERTSFKCHVKGMPVPSVQWYVRYPKGTTFEPVPTGESMNSRRWGFSQYDGEIKFSALPVGGSSANGSQSQSSSSISTEVSRFQFYCQASNILGVHRSKVMDVERVPPPKNLKIEYSTHEILPKSRARVACGLSSDQNYFVIDHWELRMEGDVKSLTKVDKSSSKYRFITLADQPELHILNVTTEELDKLYVRCVYRSTITRDLLTNAQHVTPTPHLGIKLKRLNTDRPPPLLLPLLTRPRVAQGEIVELPCYSLYVQDSVDWYFIASNSRVGATKIDVKQNSAKYSLQPPEPGGNLVINRVDLSDAGTYNCRSSNTRIVGEAMFILEVTVPLSVNLEPEDNLVSLNQSIELNCKVYGFPRGDIQWLYNGRPLSSSSERDTDNGAVVLSPEEKIERGFSQRLIISKMTVDHIGVYQCLIQAADRDALTPSRRYENAEDFSMILMEKLEPQLREQVPAAEKNDPYKTAQVKLSMNSQVAPSSINLMCQFYGHPEPVIMWYIDDQPVPISTEVTVPQIEDPQPSNDRLVPALAYVKETKLRIDLTRVNDVSRLWQYGGEYKAVATNYPLGKDEKMNKSADCRFMVLMDTKLNIRPMDSVRTCTVGSNCTLHCYAVAFNKVKLQWSRLMDGGYEQDVPMDHRQEVVNGGRTLIFREVEESHKGIYQCLAVSGSERKTATIQLKVSFAPQISPFQSVIAVTEGENTVTQLCTSKVNAEKPWFAWWEFRPVGDPNKVVHYCDHKEGTSLSITYARGPLSEPGEMDKEWIRKHPCMKQSTHWLSYANRVPTLNILHPNRAQHQGRFTCVIQNSVGMDQLPMNITFTPEYQFRKKPPNKLAVTLGDSVNVDCEAKSDNYAPPLVEWRYVKTGGSYDTVPQISRDGRFGLSGYGQYDNGTLSLWNVEEDIPRKYYCFLQPRPDSKAKAKSTAVNVDVNIPATITPLNDPMEVRKGSTFNITCDVRGDPEGMSVTWLRTVKDGSNRHEMISTICDFDGKKSEDAEDENMVLGGDESPQPFREEETQMKHCLASASMITDESTRRMRQFFVYKSNGKGVINHLQLSDVTERESTEYKCIAKNKYNKNGEAASIRTLLIVVSRPSPVKFNKYVQVEAKSVTFIWLSPESDGGKSIKHYKVTYFTDDFRKPNSSREFQVKLVNDLNIKKTTVENLRPFTNYTLSVVAVNEVGESDAAVLNITTEPARPDGSVLNLRANGTASDVIEVHWEPPAPDQRNGIITGYKVCYLRRNNQSQPAEMMNWDDESSSRNPLSIYSQDFSSQTCVDVEDKTRHEIVGLPKFTDYGVRVIAVNKMGTSPPAYTHARTMEDLPQEPPEVVTPKPDVNRCRIQWHPPKPNTLNGVLTGYVLTYFPTNELGDESLRKQVNISKSTSHDLTSLQPFTNYTIRVQAQNSKGVGPPSKSITCTTKEGKPGPVRFIKALALNESCIVVSWLPPEQSNGIIREYCVSVRYGASRVSRNCAPSKADMQQWHIVCGLSSSTNYSVSVQAATIDKGDISDFHGRVSPTADPSDSIISIGYPLQVLTNSHVSMDCLTIQYLRRNTNLVRYWEPPSLLHKSRGDRVKEEFNGTLFIRNVYRDDSGPFSCHTQEQSIVYQLSVLEMKKEPPRAPMWQQKTSNPHGIQVTWLSQGSTRPDTPITGFLLEWKNLNTGEHRTVPLRETERSYYLNPLPCASAVQFRIRSRNDIGFGQWSDTVVYNTTGRAPLIGNEKQLTHSKGQNWIYLNLTNTFPPGDGCWPEIYEFRLSPSREGQMTWHNKRELIVNQTISRASLANRCCWNITTLQSGSQYSFFINALNAAGNSSVTGVVETVRSDTTDPPTVLPITTPSMTEWYMMPAVLFPLVASLFILILLIITLLLCAKRRWMEEQHRKPPVIVHQTDINSGVASGAMRHGQYQRSSAADKPLPPKPIYNSQESKASKVYSLGNSSDPPIIYPAHRRGSEDTHSVLSYNSECEHGTLGGDIEPYAVYERNGIRIGGPGGGDFIATDPMTMSITSVTGNGLMRQRSRRSASGSSGAPSMSGPHRQTSVPSQSGMAVSTHLSGNGAGAYHYPQYRGGQPVMCGTMRPTRLGGGGLASHRLDEESGGTPTGRKSSSLDCLHKIGADIPDHHRFPPGPLPGDMLRGGYPPHPQAYAHGQLQPPNQLIAPQNSIQPAGIRPQPTTNNGNDGVYRGGTSTVSSNHDELAQAYEASAYPMAGGGGFGPSTGPNATQARPALMPSTTAALTSSIPITSTQQPQQQALPTGNDSSGSSIDPGIREFTQQPPRPAETRQAVCQVGGVLGAAPMAEPPPRQQAPAASAAGRRPGNTRGPPRHNYQRGISDISDTYDSIENATYYPTIPAHNIPARTYGAAPAPIMPGVGRHAPHPQDIQQRQPLLAPNEEWGDASAHEAYTRGGHAPYKAGGRPAYQSAASNMIHPRELAAARGDARCIPQPQQVPQSQMPAGAYHPEKRSLLGAPSSSMGMGVPSSANPHWIVPTVNVNVTANAAQSQAVNDDDDEEDPYTDKFTMV